VTQLEIAVKRIKDQGKGVDPEGRVGRFSSSLT